MEEASREGAKTRESPKTTKSTANARQLVLAIHRATKRKATSAQRAITMKAIAKTLMRRGKGRLTSTATTTLKRRLKMTWYVMTEQKHERYLVQLRTANKDKYLGYRDARDEEYNKFLDSSKEPRIA
ncbi:hypothetical protein RvY_02507 [Ramazzottius varieornatus]|uniref:Uncharacterized protein n=1 Tax=Ramazzottius varieornatus TaxID=947166 RepID=A0A1D1UV32_RAMVA|nr:hypothetical protein RvY_02507 [Ramazzottius varieornatus]